MTVNIVTTPTPPNSNLDRAMSVWVGVVSGTTDPLGSDAKQQTLLNWCSTKGVNLIFLDMWNYLGGGNYTIGRRDAVKKFVSVAHGSGIRVMAMAGNSDWGHSINWVLTNIIKNLAQYQASADAVGTYENGRFDGIILDAEYWTVGGYDAQTEVAGLLDIVGTAKKVLGIPVGMFTTQWLVSSGSAQQLTYRGVTDYEGNVIMSNCDFTWVGCYSNNSATQIAEFQPWYDYASAQNRNVGLFCGSDCTPPSGSLSYFSGSRTAMETNHVAISNAFVSGSNSVFRGQAINSYSDYSGSMFA